jgi:hypothetical protein
MLSLRRKEGTSACLKVELLGNLLIRNSTYRSSLPLYPIKAVVPQAYHEDVSIPEG